MGEISIPFRIRQLKTKRPAHRTGRVMNRFLKFDSSVKVNAQQFSETTDYFVVELNPMIFVFANCIWIAAACLACLKCNGHQTFPIPVKEFKRVNFPA